LEKQKRREDNEKEGKEKKEGRLSH